MKYRFPDGGMTIPGITDFKMPRATSSSIPNIQEQLRQKAAAEEIARRNTATAKRQFVGQGKASTKESETRRMRLNQQYVAQQPNAQIDQFGNVSTINPNMTAEGKPANFMGERQQKGYEHIMGALEGAGYVTGAAELGKLGYEALRNTLGNNVKKEIFSLENIPEEIGGYEGDVPEVTGKEYSKLLKQQELQKQTGNLLREEGLPFSGDNKLVLPKKWIPSRVMTVAELEHPETQAELLYKNFSRPSNQKFGGVIKDDRGQWVHPGEITEIGSNNITMQGVPYPVLGISDTGHTQMMFPGEDYKFKGKKVTEFPIMQKGGTLPPIYTSYPKDPRIKNYTDSLHLYNTHPKVVEHPLTANDELRFELGFRVEHPKIKPIGQANRKIVNEGPNSWLLSKTYPVYDYVYKKPVQPVVYQEEPTLQKKVTQMDVIPISQASSISPTLRTITGQAPDAGPVQRGEYRTSYYDPNTKDWAERAFMTQAESDEFANEMSQRGFPGAYGNVTQTRNIKKFGGGMFPRYHSYAPPRMKEGGSLCKDMYGNTIQCPPGYTSGSVVYATNQGATSDHTRVVINSPLGNKTLGNFPNKVVGNVGPRKEIPGEMILNTTGKLLDPTGISSWGDAGTAIGEAIDNPNLLNILGASMETLGALPLVHYLGATAKLPKTAKVISEAEKTSKLKKVLKGVGTTAKWVSGEPIVAGIDKITGAANALEDANKFLVGVNRSNRFINNVVKPAITNYYSKPSEKSQSTSSKYLTFKRPDGSTFTVDASDANKVNEIKNAIISMNPDSTFNVETEFLPTWAAPTKKKNGGEAWLNKYL